MARLERNSRFESTIYLNPSEIERMQDAEPGDVITSGYNGSGNLRIRVAIEEAEDLPDWWGG